MKSKTILVTLFVFLLPNIYGQIKVINNGNVGIGTTNPLSRFSLDNAGYEDCTAYIQNSNSSVRRGLQVYHLPADETYNYGTISSIGYNSYGWKLTGIYSAAFRETNTDDIFTFGIRAYAGRGHNGLNYGVMGKLVGDRQGTGIFGCDSQHGEAYIYGDYAGYFLGDVHISGDLTVSGSYPSSDINLKKDIKSLDDNVIDKLLNLQVIRYKLKHPSELTVPDYVTDTMSLEQKMVDINSEKYTKERIGLIAQELQTTFPEVVKEGQDGYLGVNYDMLIPVLIKAIKEQQLQIEKMQSEIDNLKSSNDVISEIGQTTTLEEFIHPVTYNTK